MHNVINISNSIIAIYSMMIVSVLVELRNGRVMEGYLRLTGRRWEQESYFARERTSASNNKTCT
jgi:hypothetical protein